MRILGTISGTSADGIDIALLETDGGAIGRQGPFQTIPYPEELKRKILARARLRRAAAPDDLDLAQAVTEAHIRAVDRFIDETGETDIEAVAFHGQTVWHDAAKGETVQLGLPQEMADVLNKPVVARFRDADIRAGGQGAPIAALYHAAMVGAGNGPVAILNVGGIANVTLVATGQVLAFDTGPGNVLIDELMLARTGRPWDAGGAVAARGKADPTLVARALSHPFYRQPAPKSLDRLDLGVDGIDRLSLEDAAATLLSVTVEAIARSVDLMPETPGAWYVCGGGRHNRTLLDALDRRLTGPVAAIEALGFDGDAIEAQAMAFLGARSHRGLALTLPSTTGVSRPMPGGVWYQPRSARRSN
ncbi:MAG: anhydro-N-acetylmuramic acid kinase [Geminicoccaceae bacterium]